MWKILTAQIRAGFYNSLMSSGMIPREQKECHEGTRGTGDPQYIDQHILKESKTRRKGVAVTWIDYKKAYDIVPQSWIIDCLKM